MPRLTGVSAMASLLVSAGCSAKPDQSSAPASDHAQVESEKAEAQQAATRADAAAPVAREQPIVLITDPTQLARLPHAQDFGALVFGHAAATTQDLHALAEYREFISDLDLGGSHAYNLAPWWFNDPQTSLSLVAVVNRIDRRDFSTSGCGETRLIFRLGYAEPSGVQRLPVAFNLVFAQADDGHGCTEVARKWMVAEGADPIDALTREGGPLAPAMLSREHLLVLESNVRNSEDRNAVSENQLLVFEWNAAKQRLQPSLLEWQPGYKDAIIRAKIRPLLTPERLADIERGAGIPPDDLKARWASVFLPTPTDWGNSPFEGIWQRLDPEDFPLPEEGLLATGNGVEHRLNGMSCSGCHVARSIAGFHLPGAGGSEQLLGGVSAHLLVELPWRARYVEALARGEEPDRTRNLHNGGPPGFGSHCSLEDSPIDSLGCAPGSVCTPVPTPMHERPSEFGVCLPDGYEGPRPCDRGPQCQEPSGWFPGGFARQSCVEGQPCAPVPLTTDYAACREADDPWACAHQQAERIRVDGCASQSDCRDGYACVAAPDGAGVCLPTATLAEFRLIGHATRLR
jgi:hypothetical protein